MALPFLLAIPFPTIFKWLPKPGAWMNTFRHALGWPMLTTALWLLYVFASQTDQLTTFMLLGLALLVSLTLWFYGTRPSLWSAIVAVLVAIIGLWTISGTMNRPQMTVWQPFTAAAVETARQTGNPVFVDFTADWCLTCKVTEATVLDTEKTQMLFASTKTTLFQADWTNQNPEITAELTRHGRKGVPLYLLYLPGKEAEILPQLLTYNVLKEKLAQLQP
jgi:thiol:disulfide interchange protein